MTHSLCSRRPALALVAVLLAGSFASPAPAADDEKFNYDESKVPRFVLPDPLVMNDGRPVTSAAMWRSERRPELLAMFEQHVYGRRPPEPEGMRFHVTETDWHGKGTRKKVDVTFFGRGGAYPGFAITLFAPRRGRRPAPAFVGMHLFDTKSDDPIPGKLLTEDVGMPLPGKDILSVILDRGYAIATLDAADFCPDDKEKFRDGLLKQWNPDRTGSPGPEEPGAIATWAWGLSRALDYFACDPAIDERRVAVIGHSRMGKTALWAGAEDPRFAMVISNDSGCGGAALSRRRFGETVARINRVFPHWFCENFSKYNDREDQLPVDQHELVALSAPRPVYVASAAEDGWADPRGEFLAASGAEPVYRLFGLPGLGTSEPPPLNQSTGAAIGYHIRAGKHALTDFDWLKYLDFADRHWK
ncbi:MAG: acetylxylan esterase [Pirellulales bacterium]